jgi:hypothetical protein
VTINEWKRKAMSEEQQKSNEQQTTAMSDEQ